jgi:hypothetical protein
MQSQRDTSIIIVIAAGPVVLAPVRVVDPAAADAVGPPATVPMVPAVAVVMAIAMDLPNDVLTDPHGLRNGAMGRPWRDVAKRRTGWIEEASVVGAEHALVSAVSTATAVCCEGLLRGDEDQGNGQK